MHRSTRLAATAVLASLTLAACQVREKPEEAPAGEASVAATGEVGRVELAPTPTAAPPVQQAVIQTQPGPRGSQVALNKVAVTGDVLTVQMTYTRGEGLETIDLDEISVIEDASARQLGILQDDAGEWLAAPKNSSGNSLFLNMRRDPVIVWFKTPAPAPDAQTVSINVPGSVPFDGVPVTR